MFCSIVIVWTIYQLFRAKESPSAATANTQLNTVLHYSRDHTTLYHTIPHYTTLHYTLHCTASLCLHLTGNPSTLHWSQEKGKQHQTSLTAVKCDTKCNLQCALCSVQSVVFHCALCSVWCVVSIVLSAVYWSVQCKVCSEMRSATQSISETTNIFRCPLSTQLLN